MSSTTDATELRLGRLAVAKGRLTSQQLQEARARQQRSGEKLDHVLLKSGYLSPAALRQLSLELAATFPTMAAPPSSVVTPIELRRTAGPPPEVMPPPPVAQEPEAWADAAALLRPLPAEEADASAILRPLPPDETDASLLLRPLPPEEGEAAPLPAANSTPPAEDEWAAFGDLPPLSFSIPPEPPAMTPAPAPVAPEAEEITASLFGAARQVKLQVELVVAVATKEGVSRVGVAQAAQWRINGQPLGAEADIRSRSEVTTHLVNAVRELLASGQLPAEETPSVDDLQLSESPPS